MNWLLFLITQMQFYSSVIIICRLDSWWLTNELALNNYNKMKTLQGMPIKFDEG